MKDFLGIEYTELSLTEQIHSLIYCWTRFNINRVDLMFKDLGKKGGKTIKIDQSEYRRLEKEMSKGAPTKQDIKKMCKEHIKQQRGKKE